MMNDKGRRHVTRFQSDRICCDGPGFLQGRFDAATLEIIPVSRSPTRHREVFLGVAFLALG
jgi:hypothetical protein